MPSQPLMALSRAFAARYRGASRADPEVLVLIYQEIAMINFLIMAWLSPAAVARSVNALCMLLMAALWLWARPWPLKLRAWASLCLIFIVITADTWFHGGLNSIFMVWYLVIPVPLMLMLGQAAMLASFVIIAALALLTYLLQDAGWLAALPSPGTQLHVPLVTMVMMMLTILSLPVVSYLVLQQILTRQQQRNQELREAQDVLLQQRRQQDEFVASVSHELRTPMNAIMGFLQAMDTERMHSSRNREMFSAMNHSAKHLLTVINDLLDFSQIQAGNLRVTPRPMSLHGLLHDVATMFEAPLTDRGIALRLHLSKDVPDWIEGDADRITQVIINLLGNAAKFTRQGQVTLRALKPSAQQLRIEVEDTGCGIAPEQMQAVFDRFSQLTDHTRREYGGTGLGLSISQNLVRLMGGHIGVESVVNEGSTFWFELPIALSQAPQHQAPRAQTPRPPLEHLQGVVLVVDDSPINRVVAKQMILKDLPQVQVLEASSGAQALSTLSERAIDVVLMDVIMPEMDGMEATQRILAGPEPRPVVIGLTADITKRVQQGCLNAGMVRVLTKPYTRRDLVDLLASHLRRDVAEQRP